MNFGSKPLFDSVEVLTDIWVRIQTRCQSLMIMAIAATCLTLFIVMMMGEQSNGLLNTAGGVGLILLYYLIVYSALLAIYLVLHYSAFVFLFGLIPPNVINLTIFMLVATTGFLSLPGIRFFALSSFGIPLSIVAVLASVSVPVYLHRVGRLVPKQP